MASGEKPGWIVAVELKYLKKRVRSWLSGFWRIGARGRNNVLKNQGSLDKVSFDIVGHDNTVSIGRGAILENVTIFMRGNGHRLIVSDLCRISGGSIWFEDCNCTIELGWKSSIESGHLAVTEPGRSILIGAECMLANNIQIRTGDSHSIILEDSGERINFGQDVVIGRHVWLAENVTVLKGVSIGDNSIVGLGSILAQDLPPHSLAVGVPAKVVRNGVNWKRERIPRTRQLPD